MRINNMTQHYDDITDYKTWDTASLSPRGCNLLTDIANEDIQYMMEADLDDTLRQIDLAGYI